MTPAFGERSNARPAETGVQTRILGVPTRGGESARETRASVTSVMGVPYVIMVFTERAGSKPIDGCIWGSSRTSRWWPSDPLLHAETRPRAAAAARHDHCVRGERRPVIRLYLHVERQ